MLLITEYLICNADSRDNKHIRCLRWTITILKVKRETKKDEHYSDKLTVTKETRKERKELIYICQKK